MLKRLMLIPWRQVRSYLFAGVGVLAVSGIATSAACWWYIGSQKQTIEAKDKLLVTKEAQVHHLTDAMRQQIIMHRMEQQQTRELQTQLAAIEAHSTTTADRLKDLEKSNAEVRDYLRQPIPAELRSLLNEK